MTQRRWILLGIQILAIGLMVGVFLYWPGRVQVPVAVVSALEWFPVDSGRLDSRGRLEAASARDPEFLEKLGDGKV
jgi:hypothetical protein